MEKMAKTWKKKMKKIMIWLGPRFRSRRRAVAGADLLPPAPVEPSHALTTYAGGVEGTGEP